MKLNTELHKELVTLKATVDFHIQQLQDAVRRTFLALEIPLDSKLDLNTGEITLPEKTEDGDTTNEG